MLSKKIKIKLNHNQQIKLETLSNEHRLLYNFLLEKTKKIIDFKQLNKYYKDYRNINNLTIQSKSAQNTCISLINNIKSYLSLKKKDKTSKFPYKFKSYRYFTSFMLDYNIGHGGFKIINNQLHLNLKQRYKYKLIIDLPDYVNDITSDNIKTITFKKENNNYYLIFVYQEDKLNYNLNKNNFLGIDLGYSDLLVGVSNKGNIKISNLRQKKLQNNVEEVQSIKDKLEKGSRRYNKTNETFKRKKKKLFNTQKDFQHKSSKKIIDFCINNDIGSIILGDIKVKKIVKKENKKINGLSKSTSSLSRFKTYLEYKSKNVGIEFKLINEYNTSKTNCLTDKVKFNSSLSNRIFEVSKNIFINRDLNSAINITKKSGVCLTQDDIIHLMSNKIDELTI